MPYYREVEEPLDNLSKEELELLKVKNEIIKTRFEIKEKNKSWFKKNLAILIPSFIGLGTVVTGIVTGYFSAEHTRLENQRHDLVEDIKGFKNTRDSLNSINLGLSHSNDSLTNRNNSLEHSVVQITGEKGTLTKEVEAIGMEKNKLRTETRILGDSIGRLRNDVSQAAFKEYLRGIVKEPRIATTRFYEKIIGILHLHDNFYSVYLATLKKVIDTTNSSLLKADMFRILNDATGELQWKQKLFDLAKSFCTVTRDEDFLADYAFWEVYWWEYGKNREEKIEMEKFLGALITQYNAKENDTKMIIGAVGNLIANSDTQIEFYNAAPQEFCTLTNKAIEYCLNSIALRYDYYGFLQYASPIAFVCTMSELLKDPSRLPNVANSNILGEVVRLIQVNDPLLSKPVNLTSAESWADWQHQNSEVYHISMNVKSFCSDSASMVKIIGRRY
jgi:hypothetical protein